ncbi:MAG TPA: hypothetical protein VFM18_02935 [Methanosarcina sp.]|nr:hypothetical protein [Methanosarcina sp.]
MKPSLTHSTQTIAINSLKRELKQIESQLNEKKDALKICKIHSFPIISDSIKHGINKGFTKEFSKLEKKKAKIVTALTELKNAFRLDPEFIGFTGVISSNSDGIISRFDEMVVGEVYEIVSHSNVDIIKDVWVGCRAIRNEGFFQFITQSSEGFPDESSLNADMPWANKWKLKMKKVSNNQEPKTYTLDEIEIPENIGKKFKVIDADKIIWCGAVIEIYKNNFGVIRNQCIKNSEKGFPSIGSYFCVESHCKFIEMQS